jgi:hypothetical protein
MIHETNNNIISCDVINTLQDYFLSENNIKTALKNRVENVKQNVKKEKINTVGNKKQEHDFFIPREKDSLFWCFYLIKNGDVSYEMLGLITPIIEKKFKIDYVEKIRKNKILIKPYKFSSISNIENQLANEFKIDLKTLLTLCVIENINVFFINKKTYYELKTNDSNDIFVIKKFDNDKFGYKLVLSDSQELETYKSSLFKIDNIDKPIKSISSYKVSELIEYCNKLVIETVNKETGKIKSKKDLYESFIQYF